MMPVVVGEGMVRNCGGEGRRGEELSQATRRKKGSAPPPPPRLRCQHLALALCSPSPGKPPRQKVTEPHADSSPPLWLSDSATLELIHPISHASHTQHCFYPQQHRHTAGRKSLPPNPSIAINPLNIHQHKNDIHKNHLSFLLLLLPTDDAFCLPPDPRGQAIDRPPLCILDHYIRGFRKDPGCRQKSPGRGQDCRGQAQHCCERARDVAPEGWRKDREVDSSCQW